MNATAERPQALVTTPSKGTFAVKNLRWLVDHADEVEKIDLGLTFGGKANLVVFLEGSKLYRTQFADQSVALDWLSNRRSMYGTPVTVTRYGRNPVDFSLSPNFAANVKGRM